MLCIPWLPRCLRGFLLGSRRAPTNVYKGSCELLCYVNQVGAVMVMIRSSAAESSFDVRSDSPVEMLHSQDVL